MNIKANYEELKDMSSFVLAKENDLQDVLADISKEATKVKNAWKGYDSDIFVEKLNSFIAIEEIQNERIRVLGEILKTGSSVYSDKDLEWQRKMKEEVENDGKRY